MFKADLGPAYHSFEEMRLSNGLSSSLVGTGFVVLVELPEELFVELAPAVVLADVLELEDPAVELAVEVEFAEAADP